jgi:hypothetical protein
MPVAAATLIAMAVVAAARAMAWPLVHDAPLIHYVVFLMEHGRAPYRDIIEMNMPGTYMVEWAGMHLLGGGAFGWWLYDVLLGAVGTAASAWIAGPGKRSVGLAAGAMAYLIHQHEGPSDMGQRDWFVAAALMVAIGCMFQAIRSGRPAWMAAFMGLCGVGASIKPPVLAIGLFFLAATCWPVRQEESKRKAFLGRTEEASVPGWPSFVLWAFVGVLVPAAAVVLFLTSWGVTAQFFEILRGLVPWYAGLGRLSVMELLGDALAFDRRLALIGLGGVVAFILNKSWRRWESQFLGLAALSGLALFVAQGKGWSYHMYTEIAFVALWGTLELDTFLRSEKRRRTQIAVASVLILTAAMIAQGLWKQSHDPAPIYPTVQHLESDLKALGGPRLSGKVQCLDMVSAGCINVLYRLQIVQSTGFIYDFYLFPKQGNAVTERLQERFLREMTAKAPEVIVLSSHTWPGDFFSYEQVRNWPAFEQFLQVRYRLAKEFPQPLDYAGYRIYTLKSQTGS